MKCKKLVAVLLAAVFVLGFVAPALAGDGSHLKYLEQTFRDHPWQDDNAKDGKVKCKPFTFVLGPWIITLPISMPTGTQKLMPTGTQKLTPTSPSKPKPVTAIVERAK